MVELKVQKSGDSKVANLAVKTVANLAVKMVGSMAALMAGKLDDNWVDKKVVMTVDQ